MLLLLRLVLPLVEGDGIGGGGKDDDRDKELDGPKMIQPPPTKRAMTINIKPDRRTVFCQDGDKDPLLEWPFSLLALSLSLVADLTMSGVVSLPAIGMPFRLFIVLN